MGRLCIGWLFCLLVLLGCGGGENSEGTAPDGGEGHGLPNPGNPDDSEDPASAVCRSVVDEGQLLEVHCAHETRFVPNGRSDPRRVIFQLPAGEPPSAGWPVAMLFHGRRSPIVDFRYRAADPDGGIHQGNLIRLLLESGYAVVAPSAPFDEFWQTNVPPLSTHYERSSDFRVLTRLLQWVADGTLGPLDAEQLFAMGISSGGYQTSRMAEAFPGRFRALAIHSASWATCVGPICRLPDDLPPDHPPTLFIHGLLDEIVPWETMDRFHDRLLHAGIETERVLVADGGHAWFEESPGRILEWFRRKR